MLNALNDNGEICASVLIVWDNSRAYYLMGASSSDLKSNAANSLLIWEGIKRVSDKNRVFDFEGSMIAPVEKYFRSFGTEQVPYFQINKTDSKVLNLMKY